MNTNAADALTGMASSLSPAHPAIVILLKVTLLLLAALGCALALQRASAGTRHLVWLTALGALLVVPPLAVWGPIRLPLLPGITAPDASPLGARAPSSAPALLDAAGLTARPDAGSDVAPSIQPGPATPPLSLGSVLLIIWTIVALALLARLLHGAWMVRRVIRRARPLDDPSWQTPLYEIADRLGLEAAPRLLQSSDVKMPFAAGLLRATIVLPAESEAWSRERRSAVLIHELGHVRRRDLIGHTLSRVACVLYWFHPLVWTAARRLRAESERACDDLALVFGARPSDYAEHLLDIVTCVRDHNTPAVALAMAHRREFEGRMLAILNPELTRHAPGRREAATTVAALAGFALLVGAAAPVPRPAEQEVIVRQQPAAPAETVAPATTSRGPEVAPVVTAPAPHAARAAAAAARPEPRPDAATAGQKPEDDRVTALARALRSDTSARVRQVAAWGLQRYARTEVGAAALTAALTSDADSSVREMAAWALSGATRSPAAAAALVRAMRQDRSAEVRSTAVWALGSIGDRSAVDALSAVLGDADAEVREVAAWSLGNCGLDQAPAPLIKALSDSNRDVRESVAWALYVIRDPESAAPLEAAFRRETDGDVRLGIIRALGRMGDRAVETLERLVSSSDPQIREVAITALAGGNAGGPWPWPRPRPRPFP